MKVLSVFLFIGSAILAGCGSGANNANTSNVANMRGANTNTGYVTNSETNARPAMPVNATNISPPSMNGVTGNSNTNHNSSNMNRNSATPSNSRTNTANTRRP